MNEWLKRMHGAFFREVAGNQKYTGIIRERGLFKVFQTSHILAIIRGEYSRGIFVICSDECSGGYSGEHSGEHSPRTLAGGRPFCRSACAVRPVKFSC